MKKEFVKGACFLILASLTSVINDVCMKYVALNAIDTLFLRSLSASLILLPLIIYYKPVITLKKARNHAIRAIIFGIAMCFYIKSLKKLPLAAVTTINFSIPFWVVIFAHIFLKEKFNKRIISVLCASAGVLITCIPIWEKTSSINAMILLAGALGFALLDVFNKYLLNQEESSLMMLFGSSIGITMLFFPFFSFQSEILFVFYLLIILICLTILIYSFDLRWLIGPKKIFIPFIIVMFIMYIYSTLEIEFNNVILFLWLGIGSNLLLYFILKAWKTCDIAALQSIKYIEFPIALLCGSIIFNDGINWFVISGFLLIFIGMIINIWNEVGMKKIK